MRGGPTRPPSRLTAASSSGTTGPPWLGLGRGWAMARERTLQHWPRVEAAEQFSNTVSMTGPADKRLVVRSATPRRPTAVFCIAGKVLVQGLDFSPDHRTLVSVGSNSVTFIDTASNAVKARR